MPEIESINEGLILIAVLGVMVVNQVLAIMRSWAKDWWDHRRGNGTAGAVKELRKEIIGLRTCIHALAERLDGQPPYPQCYYDKDHFDRIKRLEDNVGKIEERQQGHQRLMDQGVFIAYLQPWNPPAIHIRHITVGAMDRTPASDHRVIPVIKVLQAVQIVQVPLNGSMLSVDLEGVQRLVTPCVAG